MKCDPIKRLIPLTSDYINRLSLHIRMYCLFLQEKNSGIFKSRSLPLVNFINILRARFLNKSAFFAKT